MEEFLDSLWLKTEVLIHYVSGLLDFLFGPLNSLGPSVAVSAIAFIAVLIAKYLTKIFKTKRYKELQRQFSRWFNLRQEALKCEDSNKGKLLAKNIDQAKLNKVYYDYFFESFLNSLLTKYIPILLLLAYVNEAYKSSNLLKLFGREYIFKLRSLDGEVIVVGAVFWFVVSILSVYAAWFVIGRIYSKYIIKKKTKLGGEPCPGPKFPQV